MAKRFYEVIKRILPERFRGRMKQMLQYANMEKDLGRKLGKPLFFSIIGAIAIVTAGLSFGLGFLHMLGWGIALIIAVQFTIYIKVYFRVDKRKREMEKVLPDILQLIASNLQAGMTPYLSIKKAAREEFGIFAEELRYAIDAGLGTKNFSEELLEIGDRVDSATVRRTLKLISSSLSSGGQLRQVLEELSEDISETETLKKEMISNTKTYIMFIMFTVIVGAPLLLAISVHFVGMVQDLQDSTSLATEDFGLGFLAGEIAITPSFLTEVAIITLSITALLATMLTGTISKGELTAGLKYAPLAILGTLGMFYLSKMVIGAVFTSFG